MKPRRVKRLFRSVFTRLLIVTLAAGLAITFTVIAGFIIIRLHSQSAFERNLMLYADYLVDDLGDPPDEIRARAIARRSGIVILFDHPDNVWQTGPLPRFLNLERAWVRRHASGLTMGNSKGHHFIRLAHGGGELTFVAPRDVHRGELAVWLLVAMVLAMITILSAVYLTIRKTLNPLHTLKAGVNEVGAGRLDHRIPETGPSELRDLAQAFNSMAERLNRLLHSKEQLLLDVSHELRSPITRLKVQLEFIDDVDARESLRSDLDGDGNHGGRPSGIGPPEAHRCRTEPEKRQHGRLDPVADTGIQGSPAGCRTWTTGGYNGQRRPGEDQNRFAQSPGQCIEAYPRNAPAVSISMARKQDRLEIVVEDQGEGIPAAALPHLFEPFYRPDISRSRKTGGYGLGLSLCKAIVDAHGGSIDLVSTLGEGTRVTVTLPRS